MKQERVSGCWYRVPSLLFHAAILDSSIFSDQNKTSIVSVCKPLSLGAYNRVAPPCHNGENWPTFATFTCINSDIINFRQIFHALEEKIYILCLNRKVRRKILTLICHKLFNYFSEYPLG